MNTQNNEVVGRNEETTGFDFSYLKGWSKEQLREQLGTIMPVIEFMVAMHNAKDKVVKIDMSYVCERVGLDMTVPSKINPRDYSEVKDYSVHFDTLKLSRFGFPQDLEIFIHNFCTFLCAQKMHIELLLSA